MTAEGSELALDLYELLRDLDRRRFRLELEAGVRSRLARVQEGVAALVRNADERSSALAGPLREVSAVLEQHPPSHGLTGSDLRAAWMRFRGRMVPAYQALARTLQAQRVHVPPIRLTNHSRTAFHVAAALVSLVCLEILMSRTGTVIGSGLFAATCWLLEIARAASGRVNDRLMAVRFFQRIIHPHEHHQVNSATWFGTSMFVLAMTSPELASAAAIAVLGAGDQVAGFVGRRWGRTQLLYGRTLEGTAALVLSGTAAAFAVLLGFHPVASWATLLAVAAGAALAGAVGELASRRLDDNFTIPLAAAAGAAIVGGAFGIT